MFPTTIEYGSRAVRVHGASPTRLLANLAKQGLLLGLVVGIFFLSKPHLLLASLGGCLIVCLGMVCVRPLHRAARLVVLNCLLWGVTGFLSGGLELESLRSGGFWRGEGRCFLFYLPLIATSFLIIERRYLRLLVNAVCALTVIGIVLCILWLAGYGPLFQAELDPDTGEIITATYFVGFLTSHTGAGAFWATVAAFLFGFSLITRDRRIQVLAAAAALLTLATGGRAATIGMFAVLIWIVALGRVVSPRKLALALPAGVVCLVAGWSLVLSVPELSERMTELTDKRTVRSVTTVAEQPTLQRASGFFYTGANLEHHNLVIRVFLWKYAIRLFQESPLIGIGYGRFNDANLQFVGIPSVINLAVSGEAFLGSGIQWEHEQLMVSTGNAHNSYLHMLAETGVVGLALLLFLWYSMYKFCSPRAANTHNDDFLQGYCLGCQAAIVCLLATALAGHALAAPSGGILLTTLVGSWLAYSSGPQRDPNMNS